ncbi:MAG: hypothetical protein EOM73_17510, partial [Bacteroidia bacterium]|nr:hypothetical protein [Bacteroidia bacterium]
IMLILGCISALIVFDWFCKIRKVSVQANKFYFILGLISICLGAYSAMLFQSVYNWIAGGFEKFEFRGMTFLGGLIGGAASFIIGHTFFAKPEIKKEFWKIGEIAPASVFLAHGIGRIGCFFGGCCYGRDNKPDKGGYQKYCGQRFWKFISGNENLYLEIIEPLGYNAKAKNDEYDRLYSSMINRFTSEFFSAFCKENGEIDWNRLVQYNSSISGMK